MQPILPYAALLAECALGAATFRWLWHLGLPESFVRPRVPGVLDGPLTHSTDHRGLV